MASDSAGKQTEKTTPSPNHCAMLGRAFAKWLNKSATCVST